MHGVYVYVRSRRFCLHPRHKHRVKQQEQDLLMRLKLQPSQVPHFERSLCYDLISLLSSRGGGRNPTQGRQWTVRVWDKDWCVLPKDEQPAPWHWWERAGEQQTLE